MGLELELPVELGRYSADAKRVSVGVSVLGSAPESHKLANFFSTNEGYEIWATLIPNDEGVGQWQSRVDLRKINFIQSPGRNSLGRWTWSLDVDLRESKRTDRLYALWDTLNYADQLNAVTIRLEQIQAGLYDDLEVEEIAETQQTFIIGNCTTCRAPAKEEFKPRQEAVARLMCDKCRIHAEEVEPEGLCECGKIAYEYFEPQPGRKYKDRKGDRWLMCRACRYEWDQRGKAKD